MLPLIALLWQSDATAHATLQESVLTSPQNLASASFITGAEAGADARTFDPSAVYGVRAGGRYGRMFGVAATSQTIDTFAGDLGADASWGVTPFSRFTLDTRGFIASRFGVRAMDELAQRDPFLLGDRTEYNVGGGLGFWSTTSKRSSFGFSGGYNQAGGIVAEAPRAEGIDAHMARGALSYSYDIGPSDTIRPELRYSYSHFYNAVLNVYNTRGTDPTSGAPLCDPGDFDYQFVRASEDMGTNASRRCLHRGLAQIHTGTLALTESHAFSRRFRGSVTGGATVATPLPSLQSDSPVVRPEVRVGLTYLTRKYRFEGAYAYTYTSLGPRIGFGASHTANLDVAFRPMPGGRYRDFMMHLVSRVAYGETPVGADPLRPRTDEGYISTLGFVAGAVVAYPLVRGLSLTGGADVQLTRGASEQTSPTTGQMVSISGVQLTTIFTIGIRGTISTDPNRTVLRDPEEQDALALARERGVLGPSERLEDRTREYRMGERINDVEEIDRDWNRGESEKGGVEKEWNRGESEKGGVEKDWNRGETGKEEKTSAAPQ